MTRQSRFVLIFAVVGFCVALGPVLATAQSPEPAAANAPAGSAPQRTANIPSEVDAPVAANQLVLAFHNESSLKRVSLLEQVDASTAINPEAAISLLHDSLRDDDQLVREAALRALIRRDSVQNPVLTEADVDSFQGENAELARVHFAEKNADTSRLKELMQQGDAVVQQSAFEALATTDLPGAVEALRAELRDTKSLYRLQTLQLLTTSSYTNSPNQLLPILREAAADQDPLVRDFANQTLKEKKQESIGN
jgi:HEAT repeat protein